MDDFLDGLFAGFIIGAVIILVTSITMSPDIGLSQESANDICINLTNNTNAIATKGFAGDLGKLVCEIPSYDSTTNIIIRPAGQGSAE